MNYPISQCKAIVEMTLEQIVDIENCYKDNETRQSTIKDLKLQLATAQVDLRVITGALYVTNSGDDVWVESKVKDKPEVWEDFILAVKRNKNV